MTNHQLEFEQIDRIELLTYTNLERKYVKVQVVKIILVYLILMAIALLPLCAEDIAYRHIITIVTECILLTSLIINIIILPKAFSYKGFAIREHDITYRTGLFFPRTTTIPFCKVQQAGISQNPISRIFGLYSVNIANGAQLSNEISIPGLTEQTANQIKFLVIEHIRNDNK